MKEYLVSLSAAAILSALCGAFAAGTSFEKHIKYVCAVACLALIAVPLTRSLPAGLSLPDEDYVPAAASDGTGIFASEAERRVGEYVKSVIFEKTGITSAAVGIDIYRNGQTVEIGAIRVRVAGADENTAHLLEELLGRELGGRVIVEVDDGIAGG